MDRVMRTAAWIGAAAGVLFLLSAGRSVLVPLAMAVLAWLLLDALADFYRNRIPRLDRLPRWALVALALVTVVALVVVGYDLVSASLADVDRAAERYQANVERMAAGWAHTLGGAEGARRMVESLDLSGIIQGFVGVVTSLMGNLALILVYVLFLFLEQASFDRKLSALLTDPDRCERVKATTERIREKVRFYVWIKTATSVLTGAATWAVLAWMGVDYPVFWGLAAFFLNFIPILGALLGVAFPALLALIQFPAAGPFFLVLALLGGAQVLIGNILEPKLLGGSLNLSPLVVLLSLAVWGKVWGVTGMFLCVPLTVAAKIVLSQFDRTRPVSVLLSGDGAPE